MSLAALFRYGSWQKLPRWVHVGLLGGTLACIWYLGSIPGSRQPVASDPFIAFCYNLGHQPMYGLLGLFLLLTLRRKPRGQAAVQAFLFVFLIGLLDELHQAHVPRRFSSIWDLGSDLIGSYFALLVASWSDLPGGIWRRWLPILGLACLSLLWNLLPTFATQYPIPILG